MSVRLLLLFTALNLLNYIDRYLAPALLPDISKEFSLSHEQAGIVVSCFFLGYLVGSPLFGYLGDRYRRPVLLFIAVLLWSLATFGSGLAASLQVLLIARFFVGLGEASFASVAPGFLKDRAPSPDAVNRIFAIFFAAIPVGAALGYVIAAQVAAATSWQYAFFVGGVPGLVLCGLLLLLNETRGIGSPPPPPFVPALRELSKIRILQFAIWGYVLNAFALNGIASFISKYGVELGFESESINTAFGIIMVLTGFAGTFGGGLLAEYFAARSKDRVLTLLRYSGISALAAVPFAIAAFLVTDKTLFLLCCGMAELFVFCSVAPINTILVITCPPALVALNQGVTIFVMNLFGSALSPWLIGKVADHVGLSLAMQLSSVGLFLCGVIWVMGSYSRAAPPSKTPHARVVH